MAIFDPSTERLCVRVVYDGAASAGKTTNLRQLATLFATRQATEVHSESEVDGRTLYFDWMQIQAGAVAGVPLLCQIISVPGQVALTPRRRHLLSTADVVVYVCDSSAVAVERAREGHAVLDAVARERGEDIPLVVQANKQDQADALEGARLLEAIGLPGKVVIDAIATEGIGVVDTFVTAVRTLSRSIQERAERGTLNLPVRRAETQQSVLAQVMSQDLDPHWAAEMLLEEASAAFLVAELEDRELQSPTRMVHDADFAPLLPHADVPTGFIWPAHTGRNTLRSLADAGALAAKIHVAADGGVRHTACGYAMCSHTAMRFEGAELARQALVRAARERTQLESLLVPETVLVAQSADDGAWWLWTLVPVMATLPAALLEARRAGEQSALLEGYGVALAEAVRACVRHGFALDFAAAAFGVEAGTLRYLGEVRAAQPSDDLGQAVTRALASLPAPEAEIAVVLGAFEREMQRRLPGDDVRAAESTESAAARVRAVLDRAGKVG